MIVRRKLLIAIGSSFVSAALPSHAQQENVARVGVLVLRSRSTPSNPEPFYDAFTQAMRELGYVEGKNLVIEARFAEGKSERLPGLAAELISLKPALIVTHAMNATEALRRATSTIPIVVSPMTDPVGRGLAASLARPGGNVTGMSFVGIDVTAKQLELLKTMLPALSHVAVLMNPSNPTHPALLKVVQAYAQQIGVKVLAVNAGTVEDIERAFVAIAQERPDAGICLSDPLFTGQRRRIPELALKHRLPMIFSQREFVAAGGLMSYGPSLVDFYRGTARYADKILKGANPGDLPIEQPTRIHLAVSRKTAKAFGLTIPSELLLRADEAIE